MTDTDTLSLLFRIGTAERQLDNLDVPGDVLDAIAEDIGAVTDERPRMATEEPGQCAG